MKRVKMGKEEASCAFAIFNVKQSLSDTIQCFQCEIDNYIIPHKFTIFYAKQNPSCIHPDTFSVTKSIIIQVKFSCYEFTTFNAKRDSKVNKNQFLTYA